LLYIVIINKTKIGVKKMQNKIMAIVASLLLSLTAVTAMAADDAAASSDQTEACYGLNGQDNGEPTQVAKGTCEQQGGKLQSENKN
jgi:uncharacterized membrane protein